MDIIMSWSTFLPNASPLNDRYLCHRLCLPHSRSLSYEDAHASKIFQSDAGISAMGPKTLFGWSSFEQWFDLSSAHTENFRAVSFRFVSLGPVMYGF